MDMWEDQFVPYPRTEREYLIDSHRRLGALEQKMDAMIERQDQTNGSIRRHDKVLWAVGGGLAVVSAIVVPLFLDLVRCGWRMC